jgi:limonene-1,2-epoxide hydrolase
MSAGTSAPTVDPSTEKPTEESAMSLMSRTPGDSDDRSREVARAYFAAWTRGDFDALREILADDVTFEGPLGSASGVDECVRGLEGIASMTLRIDIKVLAVDGCDVLTWYDLVTANGALPTVNWSHVEAGRITRIRATFDPRPIVG